MRPIISQDVHFKHKWRIVQGVDKAKLKCILFSSISLLDFLITSSLKNPEPGLSSVINHHHFRPELNWGGGAVSLKRATFLYICYFNVTSWPARPPCALLGPHSHTDTPFQLSGPGQGGIVADNWGIKKTFSAKNNWKGEIWSFKFCQELIFYNYCSWKQTILAKKNETFSTQSSGPWIYNFKECASEF